MPEFRRSMEGQVIRTKDGVPMNREWATEELAAFLTLTELYRPADPPGVVNFTSHLSTRGAERDIMARDHLVEQILERVLPGWRNDVPKDRNKTVNRRYQHREAAERAGAALARDEEMRRHLGDDAPRLSASDSHPADALLCAEFVDLRKPHSLCTEGHSCVTTRRSPQAERWIQV